MQLINRLVKAAGMHRMLRPHRLRLAGGKGSGGGGHKIETMHLAMQYVINQELGLGSCA